MSDIIQKARERLNEFAVINEMYIRGFPMGKLEALIEELIDLAIAEERKRIVEMVVNYNKQYNLNELTEIELRAELLSLITKPNDKPNN